MTPDRQAVERCITRGNVNPQYGMRCKYAYKFPKLLITRYLFCAGNLKFDSSIRFRRSIVGARQPRLANRISGSRSSPQYDDALAPHVTRESSSLRPHRRRRRCRRRRRSRRRSRYCLRFDRKFNLCRRRGILAQFSDLVTS